MDQETIETACAPFVAALRHGGFAAPAGGWPAELVAAHICLNNDLIAEAAERIVAGEQPVYDNRAAVDDAEPIPIRKSIEGNGSFHLGMHFEQLQALRP